MKRQKALDLLRKHSDEIAQFGVTSLRLFGSVARDEAAAGSDVDLLVEFEPPLASRSTCNCASISSIFLGRMLI